jgi:hypothetical protein
MVKYLLFEIVVREGILSFSYDDWVILRVCVKVVVKQTSPAPPAQAESPRGDSILLRTRLTRQDYNITLSARCNYRIITMSESVMQIRLPADLLKAFREACDANDQTASQVVRAMMREYVSRNAQARLDLGGKRK